jgi:membrane protein
MSTLSLRSLSMLIKYYRRPVLTLFAITGAGIALAALSKLLPWNLSFLGSRTILMLVMIFSPLAFRSDTGRYDVDAMLPTTTATRFTAMFLISFIVIPVLIYMTWYLCGIGIFDDSIRIFTTMVPDSSRMTWGLAFVDELSNILMTGLVMITVIRSRRHVVRNSILTVFGTIFGIGIALGVSIALLYNSHNGLQFFEDIFTNVYNLAILTGLLFVAELIWIGRLLKKYRL